MSRRENQTSLSQFPSIFSSSVLIDDLALHNEHSFKCMNVEENLCGFQSFDYIQNEEISSKVKFNEEVVDFKLKRCTSFQEILMENHRNVLIESMKEYFSKIEHTKVKKYQMKDIKTLKLGETQLQTDIKEKEKEIQRIIHQHKVEILQKDQLFNKCRENVDELQAIFEIISICPKDLQFQVLYLIVHIFRECNEIIQHFRRKNLSPQLKNRSIKLSQELLTSQCLGKLFQSSQESKVGNQLEILIQKWMITFFLMKVGVFENQLDTKSIDQCLKSDIFRQINLNDLLNQQLIRPSKKIKQQ